MGILDREDLMPSFERRLREADQVDIAVAWVWAGPQLTMLQNAARDKAANAQDFSVRAVVGLDHNGTHPAALRTLSRLAQVRIPHRGLHPGGIFHPKVFIFRPRQGSIGWIEARISRAQAFSRTWRRSGKSRAPKTP